MNQTLANKVATNRSNIHNKKFNKNFYLIGRAFIIEEANINYGNCYLDLYTFRYICNKIKSFSTLYLKSYEFVIANKKIIRLEKVDIIKFTLLNSIDMIILNIVYTTRCNFNLIFFD